MPDEQDAESSGDLVTRLISPTHHHRFLAADGAVAAAPLVLLHGSHGTEADLLPLADELAPGAARLGIRGAVTMDGGYGFFRRFPDRRVDERDIATRAPILADFIEATCDHHGLGDRPIAVGFSNGAIMAAALLETRPDLLGAAILFRPLAPFTHDPDGRLDRTPVLIVDGDADDRRSPGDGRRLGDRLRRIGASVTHHVLPAGHAITGEDRDLARRWLRPLPDAVTAAGGPGRQQTPDPP